MKHQEMSTSAAPLLDIRKLHLSYSSGRGCKVRAVDGVSLSVKDGETLGIVGESGCGKSTLARALMGLARPDSGQIIFDGKDLLSLSAAELRRARLDFQMVFQDPYASLDPCMTVGRILAEAIDRRKKLTRAGMDARIAQMLEKVGLPTEAATRYPHEFSGGQRQRVAIARTLCTEPRLLVADEAVSALDVSVQSQILNLLSRLRREEGLAMLFISHDLSVVRHIADRIAVMYLGRVVEYGPAAEIMDQPLHMYTKALISASPVPDPIEQKSRQRILLAGDPPSPSNPPAGCHFAWRSPIAVDADTASTAGVFVEAKAGHWVEAHPATVQEESLLELWREQRK